MKVLCRDDYEWCWMIKLAGDRFRVGCWNRRSKDFYPICSCSEYHRAQLICEALKGFTPIRDFLVKGVD